MIITRTPFRLSFFGGGSDYNAWFSEHEGLVVGTTFHRYCYISVRPLPPFFDYKTRVVYSKTELVNDESEIDHPAVRGCLRHLGITEGLEVHHDGDLPARSGLGSSSSFTVGFLLALQALRHEMPTPKTLSQQAIHVEQQILKENVGIQDQVFAAYGGMRVIRITCDGTYDVTPLILPPDYRKALEEHILLGFTGQTRIASALAGEQIARIKEGTSNVREIHDIAKAALELFQKRADLVEIGRLLDQTWQVKRSLSRNVSGMEMDDLYETGKRAGAYGGKLLGAGGGGFFMFLAPPYRHEQIRKALSRVKVWVPFRFDNTGAQVIFHNDES